MIAVPQLNLNNTSASPVTFAMKHALKCIGFQGIGNDIVLESISLSGISLEGDLSVDGSSIDWSNLSTPDTTTINVGLNNDTLTSTLSTALTASDGYLMLIPQTLKDDAKITVKIQGEDERVFNMSDSIWTAGQYIEYHLVENSIKVSPSELTVSALGKDSIALTITCIPTNSSWKLTSPESWLKFSLNEDGSDASESVSGTGETVIYAIVDTYMLNTSQVRTADVYEGDVTSNTKVTVTQNYIKNVPSSTKSYAGAFWRCDQKGERLIRIPSTIGDWKAFVFWIDDQWSEGDIILEGGSFEWPVSTVGVDSDTPDVTGTATSITGNTDSNSNLLMFRVGLKNTYTATSTYPARYALLAITWNNGDDVQFLFIRQGEDPDYIMRPTDIFGNDQSWASSPNWRPYANKISPFNLTADTLNIQCNRARDGANPSLFADYPTQTGAFFQWASTENPRYAYAPTVSAEDWSDSSPDGYWSTLAADNESAPLDYPLTYGGTANFRRINDGITTGATTTDVSVSEIAQSLYYSPISSVANMMYAFLADGYFDRQSINTDEYAVNVDTDEVGYWGQLVYNPITKASIFIPYTGFLENTDGSISSKGIYINMWTSSSTEESEATIWNFNNENGGDLLPNNRSAGFTIRAVIE